MEEIVKNLNKKINLAKIELVTTMSNYRKNDIRKYIKRLEKEKRELLKWKTKTMN